MADRPLPCNSKSHNAKGGKHQLHLRHQKSKRNSHDKANKHRHTAFTAASSFPTIPPCTCGAQRVFEFQLLPSVLHVLDVDSSQPSTQPRSSAVDTDEMVDLASIGGMNWGSIAVYSCPESCDKSREEFLIVQESADDAPLCKRGVTHYSVGAGGDYSDIESDDESVDH